MLNSTPAMKFIDLGRALEFLRDLSPTEPDIVSGQIRLLFECLESCGLFNTRAAADPLRAVDLSLQSALPSKIQAVNAGIGKLLQPVNSCLEYEAGKKELIALNKTGVSPKVRDLPNQLPLTDVQTNLLDETVRSIECGAYRAAVVMGWNLIYEIIRYWVFSNHLNPFNTTLTTKYQDKQGQPIYTPVSAYQDFWEANPSPGERVVLDTCKTAQIIGDIPHHELTRHLRQRNNYAHPNFRLPTEIKANAYLEELIDIVTSPPFKV